MTRRRRTTYWLPLQMLEFRRWLVRLTDLVLLFNGFVAAWWTTSLINKCVRLHQPDSVLDVPFIFPSLGSAILVEEMPSSRCSPREPRQQPAPPGSSEYLPPAETRSMVSQRNLLQLSLNLKRLELRLYSGITKLIENDWIFICGQQAG